MSVYISPAHRAEGPIPNDAALDRLAALAGLMDDRFRIPGTRIRFGLDGVLGLVPGVGDTITAGIGSWIIFEAARLGCRKRTLTRMAGNLGVDWAIGLVPFLGDLFDFGFKASRRNFALLVDEVAPDPTLYKIPL